MNKETKKNLKSKQMEYIFKSSEYLDALEDLCKDISESSKNGNNEASIVAVFELELFSFIKEVFSLKYYPEKEKSINTERHISKGRIDSKIGAVVIEFKHTLKLKSQEHKKIASKQLKNYLKGLQKKHNSNYLGVVTDGTQCKFIHFERSVCAEGAFEKLNSKHLDKIIKSIVLLEKVALSPQNLVKDFCEPENNSLSKRLTLCLYSTLKNKPTDKTLMLFVEWKELFRLAHDDRSKQKVIEERHKSLEKVVSEKLKSNNEEYLVLYALQTTCAIIAKIIAYKVISKIKFSKSLIDFNQLSSAAFDTLRLQMNSLEEGAIFRSLGIGNLLEGDFFGWYSSDHQWNDDIGKLVQEIFIILTQYEDKALFENGENVYDLFKDLFIKITPDKVRHSLGEFYTPAWLADNLITESLKLSNNKHNWTALDPCAGSGTFLTILIKKILEETKNLPNTERLKNVLKRVKAIDLNPLAVLTSRINYFINISPLISDNSSFEIPVYLGDSSYVPSKTQIDNISCLSYKIKTIKGFIDIDLPFSTVANPEIFSQTMTSVEEDIHNLDAKSIFEKLIKITAENDRTDEIENRLSALSNQFIELEKNNWNGIWARIITNFLTTANLGKFDIIVGNPPWIDWKNLPEGYRERIKSICIDRHLFSGDSVTGGINLNVCALISNVAAQNWLKKDGVMSFLMPQSLIFQQTYEGFRKFQLDHNNRLYFQQLFDWTQAGHPFAPVQHKFLTFFLSGNRKDYKKGIPLKCFKKKKGIDLKQYQNTNNYSILKNIFSEKDILAGQVSQENTIFSYADTKKDLEGYSKISGESYYKGREGIEFYPQEVFLLEVDHSMSISNEKIYVKNFQNKKSKYKIPQETFILEKTFLHPLVKGIDIERFHLKPSKFVVPFPYELENTRSPISRIELEKRSKLLAQYFNKFKKVIEAQTSYNEKIIGKKHSNEFYALARVGAYSFAEHYVAFRDNTKWRAAVVGLLKTPWGELKRPQFQNHAVSISQTAEGNYITENEAHFICAVLNAPITKRFILNSSDSRSFKIKPQVYIPKYDESNYSHKKLSDLSIKAHGIHHNKEEIKIIDKKLNELAIQLKNT